MSGLPPIRIPGCDFECEHEWVQGPSAPTKNARQGSTETEKWPAVVGTGKDSAGCFCQKCGGWRGALGNEPTIEMYIGHLVAIYRKVYRCLREDGCVFVVMGDSYSSQGGPEPAQTKWQIDGAANTQAEGKSRQTVKGLGQGNLMMVPHRLALALQADGWIVRNDLVWHKKAPMPESVTGHRWSKHRIKVKKSNRATSPYHEAYGNHPQGAGVAARKQREAYYEKGEGAPKWIDCPGCVKCEANDGYVLKRGSWRHTRSHEFVIHMIKKMQYFADQEKVREPLAYSTLNDIEHGYGWNKGRKCDPTQAYAVRGKGGLNDPQRTRFDSVNLSGRNPRSVLTPKPEPFPGSHFAVFSTNLIEPLIKATCPDKCCPRCGQGWSPVVERSFKPQPDVSEEKGRRGILNQKPMDESNTWQGFPRGTTESSILGYRPTCECGHEDHIPGTVIDPFLGSGTTALVAERLGLNTIGIEISETYAEMSKDRIIGDAPLLTNVEIA